MNSLSHTFYPFIICPLPVQLDGYIARNIKGQSSMLGAALDPFADKVMVACVTITLAMTGLLPGKSSL